MSNAQFRALRSELCGAFIGREQVVNGLLVALVAREHVLLLGPPGTGKSALASALAGALGAKAAGGHFEWLLTKFTTPEELFGPVSLTGLKQDKFERVVGGKLPSARTGFLDECFKANSAILNALLTILNERQFDNGTVRMAVPLQFCVGASNELPEDDSLQALFDRFLVRFWVDYVSSKDDFDKLLGIVGEPTVSTVLSDVEVEQAQREAAALPVDQSVMEALWKIRESLSADSIRVSDRTWRKAIKLAKAAAWLDGATAVLPEHLEVLTDSLWTTPDQRSTVAQAVAKQAVPDVEEAQRLLDIAVANEAAYPYDRIADMLGEAARLNREVKATVERLALIAGKGSGRVKAMHGQAKALYGKMMGTFLSVSGG